MRTTLTSVFVLANTPPVPTQLLVSISSFIPILSHLARTLVTAAFPDVAATDAIAFAAHGEVRNSSLTQLQEPALRAHLSHLLRDIQANALHIKSQLDLRDILVKQYQAIHNQLDNPGPTNRNGDPIADKAVSEAASSTVAAEEAMDEEYQDAESSHEAIPMDEDIEELF